jgi:ribosome biogenesis GTPase
VEPNGRVVGRLGPVLLVRADDGSLVPCLGRGAGKGAVVGDRVAFVYDPDPDGIAEAAVTGFAPRDTVVRRADPRGGPQSGRRPLVLAANVDRMLVVSAVRPPLRTGLVDRYLVAAHAEGIEARVVVNKVDLLDGPLASDPADSESRSIDTPGDLDAAMAPYEAAGYTVHRVSAATAAGLDALRADVRGHTCVLVGHSGVGKTSLLNALVPDLGERVTALSDATGKGQHTTTTATLYPLDDGGEIIDSPGVRGFGLVEVDPHQVRDHFVDLAARAPECRFADCQHLAEPGCAVRAAVEAGELSRVRYESYCRLRASLIDEGR